MVSQPCLPANAPRQPCLEFCAGSLPICLQPGLVRGCLVVGLTESLSGLLLSGCQTSSELHVLTPHHRTA